MKEFIKALRKKIQLNEAKENLTPEVYDVPNEPIYGLGGPRSFIDVIRNSATGRVERPEDNSDPFDSDMVTSDLVDVLFGLFLNLGIMDLTIVSPAILNYLINNFNFPPSIINSGVTMNQLRSILFGESVSNTFPYNTVFPGTQHEMSLSNNDVLRILLEIVGRLPNSSDSLSGFIFSGQMQPGVWQSLERTSYNIRQHILSNLNNYMNDVLSYYVSNNISIPQWLKEIKDLLKQTARTWLAPIPGTIFDLPLENLAQPLETWPRQPPPEDLDLDGNGIPDSQDP